MSHPISSACRVPLVPVYSDVVTTVATKRCDTSDSLAYKKVNTVFIGDALHRALTKILNGLGYPQECGICEGFAVMGMLAALAGDTDSFNERLIRLEGMLRQYGGDIQDVIQQIEHDSDMRAFFDGVTLWQSLEQYADLFKEECRPIHQRDPKSIRPLLDLTISKRLEGEGVEHITLFSGVYSEEELLDYLKQFKELCCRSCQDPVGIVFRSVDHTISLTYDSVAQCWMFVDANQWLACKITDDKLLTGHIKYGLGKYIMSSDIYTLKKSAESLRAQIGLWLDSPAFKCMHVVTEGKAQRTCRGSSWLMLACEVSGNEKLVESLIKAGAVCNPVIANKNQYSPLHEAVFWNHLSIIKLLLASGACPNEVNCDGCTLLSIGASRGWVESMQLLLDHGADINQLSQGKSPIYIAVKQKQLEAVECLIARGADLNIVNESGKTALGIAFFVEHQQLIWLLMKHGADLYAPMNANRDTPLHMAAAKGYLKMVDFLLSRNANPNAVNQKGNTPLHRAVQRGDEQIITQLIAGGGDPNLVNNQGKAALQG